MNNEELVKKIDELTTKVVEMQVTVKRLNSYFKWTAIITIVLFVLPLIALMFVVPSYLNQLRSISGF